MYENDQRALKEGESLNPQDTFIYKRSVLEQIQADLDPDLYLIRGSQIHSLVTTDPVTRCRSPIVIQIR